MNKSQQYKLIVLTFSGMLLFSVFSSYRGFLLPTFKESFNINNTQVGIFIGLSQLSAMAFSYWGGRYCLKIGQSRLVALGGLIMAISSILAAIAPNFYLFALAFIAMSSGSALVILGLNTVLPLITLAAQTILMNLMHGFFGLGNALTQKGLAWYISSGYNWRTLFLILGLLFLVNAISFERSEANMTSLRKSSHGPLPYKTFTTLILSAVPLYILSEFLVTNWMINFFQQGFAFNPNQAAFYSTFFFMVFMCGRMFGGLLVSRFNPLFCVSVGTAIAATCLLIGLILGQPAFSLISISGLFYSIAYPTTATVINGLYKDSSPVVIGMGSMFASLLIFLTNIFFGYFNDHIGVVKTFYAIPLLLFASSSFFFMATRELKRIQNEENMMLTKVC